MNLELLASCARALALLTPAGAVLPDLRQRLSVPAVARHVARSLVSEFSPDRPTGADLPRPARTHSSSPIPEENTTP